VLNTPPYLSGLTDVEWNVVRERARAALHPQQEGMQRWLKRALAEVVEGMAATKRMLLERCEMRDARCEMRGDNDAPLKHASH